MTESEVYQTIKKLQEGGFDSNDVPRFDPEITGHGVTVFALSKYIADPKEAVKIIKSLVLQGKVKAIDPDSQGLVSFIAL